MLLEGFVFLFGNQQRSLSAKFRFIEIAGGFPVDRVSEVKFMIDPTTGEG